MAAFMGKDVSKLKAKGGGKWKYMSEADMLKHSEKYAPYRCVSASSLPPVLIFHLLLPPCSAFGFLLFLPVLD